MSLQSRFPQSKRCCGPVPHVDALPGASSGVRGQTVHSSDPRCGPKLTGEQSLSRLGAMTGRSQHSRCSGVGQCYQRMQPLQRQVLDSVILSLLVDYKACVTLGKLCPAACLHANRWWLRVSRRRRARSAACVSRPPLWLSSLPADAAPRTHQPDSIEISVLS